jgi:hypothetical protein
MAIKLHGDKIKQWPDNALFVVLWVFVFLFPVTKIADFDLFFHLRLGEWLLEKGIYRLDTFSYTAEGRPQYLLEWLSNGILYIAYKYMGYTGLGLLKASMFSCLVFLILKTLGVLRANRTALCAALTIVTFAYAVRFRLDLRPYYFTYICLAAFIYIFHLYRRDGDKRVLYLLPAVQLLWSNTHGGMIIGPPLATLFMATEALRKKKFAPWIIPALLSVWAASALNPHGPGPFKALLSFAPGAGGELGELGEWQGLDMNLLWGYGLRYTLGFQILVLGAFVWLLREALKRRFDLFNIILFSGSLYYSIRHVRLMDLSSIILAPMFFMALEDAMGRIKKYSSILNITACILMLYLLVFSVAGGGTYSFGFGKKEGIFPDGAIKFLDENNITGRQFNTITAGSYMLWASPGRKVFIDGRLIVPGDVMNGYSKAIKSREGFEAMDGRYGFNYAIVDYDPKYRWRFPLHLSFNPDWIPVYWGSSSVVYLKNKAENENIIERFGYRILRPAFNNFTYLDHYMKGSGRDFLMGLIDKDIRRNPGLQDARLAKAYAAYYYGLKDIALNELKEAIRLKPETAFEHIATAQILMERGQKDEAAGELRRALELEPGNNAAKKLLKKIK